MIGGYNLKDVLEEVKGVEGVLAGVLLGCARVLYWEVGVGWGRLNVIVG